MDDEQEVHEEIRPSPSQPSTQRPTRVNLTLEDVGLDPSRAIVGLTTSALSVRTERQFTLLEETLELRLRVLHLLRLAAIRCTKIGDWMAFATEGEVLAPYVKRTGIDRIVAIYQVQFEPEGPFERDFTRRFNDGSEAVAYEVFYSGWATCAAVGWQAIYATGSRDSFDEFFTRGGSRTAHPGNLREAAFTRWYGKVTRKLFGLDNLTWEDLSEAGLDPNVIKRKAIAVDGKAPDANRRARKQQNEEIREPMFAITLQPGSPRFHENKDAIKRRGGRFNIDGSNRWFLPLTTDNKSWISNVDLIGVTDEVQPEGASD